MSRIETMNRKGLREHIWGRADWKPKSAKSAQRELNGFINQALRELAKDLPFLFEEAIISTPVYKDADPKTAADTLQTTTDPWVLRTSLQAFDPNATPWEDDVDWDGRTIQLKSPDDQQWHLRVIREAWLDGATGYHFVTLDRPYPGTATDIQWKVFAHVLRLPSNVVKVKTCHMQRDGISYPLTFQFQGTAEEFASIRPGRLLPTGPPRKLFRRPPSRLRAPAYTLTPTVEEPGTWVNERPPGKFEYCMTYAWGRGEAWDNTGGPSTNASLFVDASRNVPWIESPPSSVSSEVDVSDGGVVRMALPNLARAMGFDDAATLRFRRIGLRKRIYVRRLSDPSGTTEVRERFEFLTEVSSHVTTFLDNGSILPDPGAPLQDNHLFQNLELYPPPDQRYDMMMRVTLAPPRLEHDADAPHLPDVALEALVTRTLMYLYESMGNVSSKRDVTADYNVALQDVRTNYGLGKPPEVPRQRRPARVRGRRYSRRYVFSEDPIS